MSTVADYVDRTIDVVAFGGSEETLGVERLLAQTLATPGGGGEVVTGVQKLVQRFLVILLTEAGSLLYLPLSGCRFMIDARSGGWRTAADVQQSFYFALLDIKRQLLLMESESDPDDERFLDAVLLGVTLSPIDRAVIRVELVTQAGGSRRFIAPISVVPR